MKKFLGSYFNADLTGKVSKDNTVCFFFLIAIFVYAVTRLVLIEVFPTYFFCDEAIHSVLFKEMMNNAWHSVHKPHELLPAYFLNGRVYNLSLSVYVQGLVSLFAGMNIVTVRATSAIISLTGAVALALALKRSFKIREWWSIVLFLAVLPVWFLHTRTGFELVIMVSSYSWFIYFYLRYLEEDPRWIFPVMLAGAATFYSYSPGQGIMFMTGLLTLTLDFKYHLKKWLMSLTGIGFAFLLFIPYLRFRWIHPDMMFKHLEETNSYLVQSISLSDKVKIFAQNYAECLSPQYWFGIEECEQVRHLVPNYASLQAVLIPFALIGLLICIINVRRAPYRMVLIALFVTPISSAMAQPGITRLILIVVPFSLFTVLGFNWLMNQIRSSDVYFFLRSAALLLLTAASLALLGSAVHPVPSLRDDYGLYGMQWGAQAVFRDLIPPYLISNPQATFFLTHTQWNNPIVFPVFFGWMDYDRIKFLSLDDMIRGESLPESKDLVLLSAEEYGRLHLYPQVLKFTIYDSVDLPSGRSGYYLGRLDFKQEFIEEVRVRSLRK